ncbi:MAG TPA: hypothetical protein VFH47_07565, partial [Candidatus Thermoplasmatota archaeon]|nr:hypothetical protein [Candidatus Thermoplasmatota archaeon]
MPHRASLATPSRARAPLLAGALLAALLAAAAPAASQPEPGVLYLTAEPGGATPAGGTGKTFVMSHVPPAPGKAYAATSPGALTYANTLVFTGQAFEFEAPAELHVQLSCDQAAAFRPAVPGQLPSARAILYRNAEEVTRAAIESIIEPCTGPTAVRDLLFPLDATGTSYRASDELRIEVLLWWSNTDDSVRPNGHFLTGPEGTRLVGLGLPGISAVPEVLHAVLEGDEPEVRLRPEGPTTQQYQYVWNATRAASGLWVLANVTAGNASIHVVDASNATVHQVVVEASGNETHAAAGNATGDWTLHVRLQDFEGELVLRLLAPGSPATPVTP